MIEKQKEVSGKYQVDLTWLNYIPLMILVGIVPLIVRMVKVDIPEEYILYVTPNNVDLFSQAKSTIIFIVIGIMLCTLFLIWNKGLLKKDGQAKVYYACMGIYSVMTLVSMFMSDYEHVAKWGMPNRAEGGMMLISYVVIMLYAFWIIKEEKSIKFILIPLGLMIIIMTVLGYFQYIGEDLFLTKEWGKKLIIPEYYAEDREALEALYEDSRIYGTLFHYNYVGSFSALVLPIFATIMLFVKDYKVKIGAAFITVCSVFLLFGSTSRAGLIGIGCSVVVFIIIYLRYFLKHWKILLLVLGVAGVGVIGLNQATQGKIFERIPTLIQDIALFFQPGEDEGKANLPIHDLIEDDGDIVIKLPQDEIRVVRVEEGLKFYNQQGEEIVYIYFELSPEQVKYFTQEPAYEPFVFTLQEKNNRLYAQLYWKNEYIVDIDVTEENLQFVTQYDKAPIEFSDLESIGFEGKEKMGSSRGYIWSRSLPILRDHMVVGTGPDTFAFEFPQYDVLGKWHAYDTPNIVVDKPHNLYLQIGINQGGIALLAFIILIGAYIGQGFKLYALKKEYTNLQILGGAMMLGIIGYLGAGSFNDSVVSVAPIFWVLLGTGMAINYMVAAENKKLEKQKEHATIDMKTRKHV